jgi:hypothetical protein
MLEIGDRLGLDLIQFLTEERLARRCDLIG